MGARKDPLKEDKAGRKEANEKNRLAEMPEKHGAGCKALTRRHCGLCNR